VVTAIPVDLRGKAVRFHVTQVPIVRQLRVTSEHTYFAMLLLTAALL